MNHLTPRPFIRGKCWLGLIAWLPLSALALTNNLALTPQMGWNDWNSYGCGISESVVTNNANVIAANGMAAAGYHFVNIDDGWASSRNSNGVIQAYASKFPDGIPWLAAYVHSQGLKLGVYTDHGTNTCSSCISGGVPPKQPGSFNHEYVDAMTYAAMDVDYLKNDSCNLPVTDVPMADYMRMADGLMKSGQPILNSLCPNAAHYEYWSPLAGNSWRTTGDIGSTFASMISKIDQNSKSAYVAGPGRWNDPDMLEIGNGEFATNFTAAQTHFTMWCIMAAPLIAGDNVTAISAGSLAILTNAEAIAVDQDPAGEQGERVEGIVDSAEVWSKPLGYDFTTRAVALLNRSTNTAATITCDWTNLTFQPGTTATVRDLWAHQDLGTFTNSFTATIPPYGSMLLKIVGTPIGPPPPGTNYLSDLPPLYAYTGFGTQTKDKSIVGNPITVGGVVYRKGIGTHAIGGQEYDLGGICSRFQSVVGLDDEVGTNGSVIFQVFADGRKIFDSGIMTGSSPSQFIDLDLTGVRRLTLGVTDTGNDVTGNRNSNDHSDWANALVIVTNTTPQLPHAPAGLAAAPGNALTLTWSDTLAALTYNVKRATVPGGPYVTLTNTPLTGFADASVAGGVTYYYVVSAVSSFGEGSNSVEVSAAPCAVPPAPTNVTAGVSASVTNTTVSLAWSPSAGATDYIISRFTGDTPPVVITNVAATSFTDTNVTPGTIYYYFVSAANACNQSGYSAFAAANTILLNTAPAPVWNGASLTSSNWSDAANWNGINLTSGNTLVFDGQNRVNNFNDLSPNTVFSGFIFDAGAGAFVLNGNPVLLGLGLANSSPWPQVLNLGLSFSNSLVFNGAGNSLFLAAGLTNTAGAPGYTTLTLAGSGMLNNALKSTTAPGGTNVIATAGNANWTLLNNPTTTPMTVPWVLSINSGTFNFGSGSSAPILTTTTPNNSPSDNQAGTVTGATGTFNMIAGTLTTAARLNTATALNSTGIVNQTGGTFNPGSQFQGANGGNAGEMSFVNLSGGTMNIGGGGGGAFYVASRGSGTLTLTGGALNCGTLDVSRNADGNAFGSVGVVNLNGGTLLASRVGTATANAQTGANGVSATFNFNGGTLKLNSSAAPFFQGSPVAPVIPITAVVKAGGAFIDSNGHTNVFAEPLLHDNSLGGAADGGLTKAGQGSLILASNVTYTGGTLISAGALVLSNSVVLDSSPTLIVAAGGTLDVNPRSDGTLSLVGGQTLGGAGVLQGNVQVGAGAAILLNTLPATLAFSNNLTLNSGGMATVAVNLSPATNSVTTVAGTLTYGGTLVVTNTGVAPLAAGNQFKLFNATHYAGAFAAIQPAIPGINLAWNTNSLTNGILSVLSQPTAPPILAAVLPGGNHLVFTGWNGVPGWTYYLLTATNVALPPNQWTAIATDAFDAGGRLSFTNPVNQGGTNQFFRLQLQ